jgi:hypothetical protein
MKLGFIGRFVSLQVVLERCRTIDTRCPPLQTRLMNLDQSTWVIGLRAAGIAHFVTLALAMVTPIPPNWETNLAALPEIHRRFAIAQNVFIGAVIAVSGIISLCFAQQLAEGSILARVICTCIALWWGGRLFVLPWLGAHRHLQTRALQIGYVLLLAECATFALAYGYLAVRGVAGS